MATMTQTAPRVMTTEVPLVAGDIMRVINTPAVTPPRVTPATSLNGNTTKSHSSNGHRRNSSASSDRSKAESFKKGHRRASSAASDIAKAAGIDIEAVSMAEARKIMSEEHKILGFRPPHGSFAAEVQSVAAKHPEGKPEVPVDTGKLKEIAREDALRILAERKTSTGADKDALPSGAKPINGVTAPARHSPPNPGINLNTISAADARTLMSHEHRALGFRPPPGSLAAEAQSAAARHPEGNGTHYDDDTLREIALRDAERIKADRELNMVGEVNVSTVGKEAASEIVSAEAKALGHRPPSGSIAAEAQSAGDKHPDGGSFNPSANPIELAVLKDAARKEGEQLREQEQSSEVKIDDGANGEKAEPETRPAMVDKAVETEAMTEEPPTLGRTVKTPSLVRNETEESVEIVCDVIA
ncbi:hypothetical protein C8Q76DRAFT_701246 [Earliella scabrosa]|nr:hypothetical protein C8Q76DRAFT_701246 [Earliella scabrosa]